MSTTFGGSMGAKVSAEMKYAIQLYRTHGSMGLAALQAGVTRQGLHKRLAILGKLKTKKLVDMRK